MPKGRRLERLTVRLKQDLGEIIAFRLKDPRVGLTSVTRVKLAPDLTSAQVFVSVLGEAADERNALRALNHARGHIQSEIARTLEVRRHPELTFRIDEEIKRSRRINEILEEIKAESPPPEGETEGEPAEGAPEGGEPEGAAPGGEPPRPETPASEDEEP